MKSNTQNPNRSSLSRGLFLGAALLCGLAAPARAQNDPSGTWDFVVSGNQQGVAFLTFNKDFTISGFEVITSYTPPVSDDGRGGDNIGRQGSPGISASNLVFFGFTDLTGSWNFDIKGRTIGVLNEGATAGGDLAQSASFVATVRPGSRLTMKVTDSPSPESLSFKPRHRVYKGIPVEPTDDLSGAFYANGIHSSLTNSSQLKFVEFFSSTNFVPLLENDPSFLVNFPFFAGVTNSDGTPSPNAYFLSGTGPGYTNWGFALFSAQKKMAIVSVQNDTVNSNSVLRSVYGTFKVGSSVNGAGKLYGTDDSLARVSYKVWRY